MYSFIDLSIYLSIYLERDIYTYVRVYPKLRGFTPTVKGRNPDPWRIQKIDPLEGSVLDFFDPSRGLGTRTPEEPAQLFSSTRRRT